MRFFVHIEKYGIFQGVYPFAFLVFVFIWQVYLLCGKHVEENPFFNHLDTSAIEVAISMGIWRSKEVSKPGYTTYIYVLRYATHIKTIWYDDFKFPHHQHPVLPPPPPPPPPQRLSWLSITGLIISFYSFHRKFISW